MDWPYRKIACCVDRDEASDDVLREATRLAAGSPGALRVVHVIAPPQSLVAGPFAYAAPMMELRGDAEAWLDKVVADIPGAIPVLLDGPPAREVCEWARSSGVDLIVASAHRGLVERAMLGGFATHLAYHAPCSVLLVHPMAPPATDPDLASTSSDERS